MDISSKFKWERSANHDQHMADAAEASQQNISVQELEDRRTAQLQQEEEDRYNAERDPMQTSREQEYQEHAELKELNENAAKAYDDYYEASVFCEIADSPEGKASAEKYLADATTTLDDAIEAIDAAEQAQQQQSFKDYEANEWKSFDQQYDQREKDIVRDGELTEDQQIEAFRELEIEREQASHELSDRLLYHEHGNIDHDLHESFDMGAYEADHSV